MRIKSWFLIAGAMILFSSPSFAITDTRSPMETLKGPIHEIIDLLNNSSYQGTETKTLQRDRIWEIASPVFDFEEISRRAIGKAWSKFTPDEKARFTKIFSEFLGNTYID